MSTSYASLLALVAPVFAIIGVGVLARRAGWMGAEGETDLVRITVNILFPCLIFESMLGRKALLDPANVLLPPLVGYATMAFGFAAGYFGGRWLGMSRGHGLRTFAFAVGTYNYGFIPIPIVRELFGGETLSVLFVHNIGCELAIWTVGSIVVAGGSWRDGWRRLINAPLVAIVLAVTLNFTGGEHLVPGPVLAAMKALGACAVPVGLLASGGALHEFVAEPRRLVAGRVVGVSLLLRLACVPVVFLVAAKFLPLPVELRQIMIVQAAMPAGMMSLVLSRHFGGQPLIAAQVILATTLVALVAIPWWVRLGLAWVAL
ncbi:MAG: AEC family transporter [Verrucomicrobia bacterium]|nr:MAG: AEC family transporter [Verrucomicrobiota bacterium]